MSGAGVIFGYLEKFTSSRFPNSKAPCVKIESTNSMPTHLEIYPLKGLLFFLSLKKKEKKKKNCRLQVGTFVGKPI